MTHNLTKRKFNTLILLLLITGFAWSCSKDDDEITITPNNSSSQFQLMPLGDSRVEGDRPEFESYRYELWKNLLANNWDFDLIGNLKDPASYPTFQGANFDPDHEGIGGDRTDQVLERTRELVAQNSVGNVILLGIGGNDLLEEIEPSTALNNIRTTIDVLQMHNENAMIFLE